MSYQRGKPRYEYGPGEVPNIPPFLKCGLPPSRYHEDFARIPWCLEILNHAGIPMVVVAVAAMVEMDLNKLGEVVGLEVVVVVADRDPIEVGVVVDDLGGKCDGEVAITVEADVVPIAEAALREYVGKCNDTPPFLKMILIVACRGCHTAHVL